jgi:4-hydroxyphenylpyruvate dioxygenase
MNERSNPMGTDGFEFVEYTAPDPEALRALFEKMGFRAVARHRSKNVTLHRQGDINFLINAEPNSFAQAIRARPRWLDLRDGISRARRRAGLQARDRTGRRGGPDDGGPDGIEYPSIRGIGGSLIYLVDRYGADSIYDVDFRPTRRRRTIGGPGCS